MEDSSLKYFGIVGDHECDLVQPVLIFGLVDFDFVEYVGGLEDTFLHGSEYFLDDLSYFGFHLKPFEFFYLEFGILGHCNKIIEKYNYSIIVY